ncbi:ABC transporter substrate-binding protein [Luteipulveratus mongoliensis]|uniref:ABC transporter substrate-binding protein n=1 Tax=Luteipulveratus mongoliensis TaxID=571913 RepID=A0A0K1JHC0_9MICO|nr:ABC transporter substrate-binding protein [Luteipulveratus mongoliensis]AKU15985.1 ABC transporter substrate-binding protein [Luteipulveratus mongoliensis]
MTTNAISRRTTIAAVLALGTSVALAACSDPEEKTTTATIAPQQGEAKAQVVRYDTSPSQTLRVKGTYDAAIAAKLPPALRKRGSIIVGNGSAGGGIPPLGFTATDNKTPVGVELDIAYLISNVLGLKPQVQTTSFENLFVGVDSGKYDVALSNVGVSELRKEKYDFATYRLGLHAFEVKKGSPIRVKGPADLAGKRVAVGSGTLQEDILLRWNAENVKAGRAPIKVSYYQNASDYYLALASGRIDVYLGPNPSATYHVATDGKTQIVGTVSSSYPVQGKVGVLTKKGNALAPVIQQALNKTIADGTYAKVLKRWGLSSEAVPKSELNPPGLPKPAKK